MRAARFVLGSIAAMAMFPASLQAAPEGGWAMLPLLLRYQLCTHSAREGKQETIHVRCSKEREQVMADSAKIIAHFYPSDRLDASRELQLALSRTERDAARLTRSNKAYSPEVIQYVACLADTALSDPMYLHGKHLDGRPIAKKCRPLYDEVFANSDKGPRTREAKYRVAALHSAFKKLYVAPASGFDVAPPGLEVQ